MSGRSVTRVTTGRVDTLVVITGWQVWFGDLTRIIRIIFLSKVIMSKVIKLTAGSVVAYIWL